jgi:septal ring factor EnvC (AmiA/AmiB activator)
VADGAASQLSSLNQQLSLATQEKASLAGQVKKLSAERASLQEQLGSSAGDIDMLQVRVHVWLVRWLVQHVAVPAGRMVSQTVC